MTEETQTSDSGDRPLLRLALVIAQAATLAVTWPLWTTHESLPHLPAIAGLPALSVGPLLLVTLTLVIVRPRWGIALHAIALSLSMLADQLRMQPQFVSMTILLWGTLPSRSALLVARAHLVALYVYGGLHKLLGDVYIESSGPGFWKTLIPALDEDAARVVAIALAGFEVVVGLLILLPPARRAVGAALFAMHLGIFAGLVNFMSGRNEAVWAWNLALACAAPALLWNWREPLRRTMTKARSAVLFVCALIVVTPALYRVGKLDAYLSYCLYADTPNAVHLRDGQLDRLAARGRSPFQMPGLNSVTTKALGVPFPPAHRLYEAWYLAAREAGDVMVVYDPRPWARARGTETRIFTTAEDHAHLVPHGEWLDFHPDAGLASRGFVTKGVKNGRWMTFHEDGGVASEGTYVDGRRVGTWTTHTRDGQQTAVDHGPASDER